MTKWKCALERVRGETSIYRFFISNLYYHSLTTRYPSFLDHRG